MALRLYNPKTQAFFNYTPPVNEIPMAELLLLNILIELKAISHFTREMTPGSDEVSNILTDTVSVN